MNRKVVRTIALFIKPDVPAINRIGKEVVSWLRMKGIKVRITAKVIETLAIEADGVIGGNNNTLHDADMALVLGGDGTILWVARKVARQNIPVLSFNMGTLGFLAAFSIDRLYDVLDEVISGNYTSDKRMMLEIDHFRDGQLLSSYTALNDVVVNKQHSPRLIELQTLVNNYPMNEYLADGLIVSTPTGSTAYSLSAGGPILEPQIEAVVITPISPHTLTHRPIVLSSETTITIRLVSKDRKAFLTLDGQVNDSVCCDDEIMIRKSPHPAEIIVDPEKHFFEILSHKLKWGYR